jgi:hypothetical protein
MMSLFEIFIPALGATGLNITARVRAESWIQALRNGLARLGDTTEVHDILCDIHEAGIDVTEPKHGRVFRIREIAEGAQAPTVKPAGAGKVLSGPPPRAPGQGPAKTEPAVRLTERTMPAPALVVTSTQKTKPAGGSVITLTNQVKPREEPVVLVPKAKPAAPAAPEKPSVVMAPAEPVAAAPRFQAAVEEESCTQEKPTAALVEKIGRAIPAEGQSFEDLVAELMESIQGIYRQPSLAAACGFALDLAMRHVPCESGSVLISDINRDDLYFVAARGPKADAVMKYRVTMGQGIVGFCAQEGVSLAVSDVQRDPRFCAAISQAIGYETRSIICAPAQYRGRVFGAVELINKSSGSTFSGDEVAILNFLAHELADYLIRSGQTGD